MEFLFIALAIILVVFGALLDNERKNRKRTNEKSEENDNNGKTDSEELNDLDDSNDNEYSLAKELIDTPIQPRKYSKSNSGFSIFGNNFRGYHIGLKNENMKPKEVSFFVDSLETALYLTEEIHRYRAKLNDNKDFRDVFNGDLPRNPIKEFHLKGLEYRRPKATKIYDSLIEGEKVILIKEPSNPYDENAVMVYATNGEHLGYVPKYMAKEVGKLFHHVGYAWSHYERNKHYCDFLIFLKFIEYDETTDNYPYEEPNEKITKQ